jgi:alpha-glucosidase
MRAHSSGDTREREPWSYGPEAEAIIKQYIELRYKLLPYLYSVFWENHRYGFPMLRPVVMVEQQEANNAWRQDEFTLGDKMLICPVLDPGVQSRIVYLPKGEWYHYWTRERYEGPRENQVPAPLEEMPIFVRAGSVIPEYPVWQYVNEFPIEEMILNVYHANYTVNSFMYEDHGDTRAYEQDLYTEKKFVMEGHPDGLSLTQSMEGLYTPRYELYRFRIIGLPRKMTKIVVDGKPLADYTWDADRNELEFVIFKSFKTFTVTEA